MVLRRRDLTSKLASLAWRARSPTAVVKFGLTAADVGLEVLHAVVSKGAIGTDKGGSQPASSGPSAADKERRARALDEQVKQGRRAILRATRDGRPGRHGRTVRHGCVAGGD